MLKSLFPWHEFWKIITRQSFHLKLVFIYVQNTITTNIPNRKIIILWMELLLWTLILMMIRDLISKSTIFFSYFEKCTLKILLWAHCIRLYHALFCIKFWYCHFIKNYVNNGDYITIKTWNSTKEILKFSQVSVKT